MWESLLEWDARLGLLINHSGGSGQDAFWSWITRPIHWTPFFLGLIFVNFYYFKKKGFLTLLLAILTFGITALITTLVKNIVTRIRPIYHEVWMEHFRFVTHADGYSYFSGHTSNSMAVSLFFYLVFRKKTPFAVLVFIWPILFAYSRLYLGVHYPLDVLSGGIVGTLVGYGVYLWYQNYIDKSHQNSILNEEV